MLRCMWVCFFWPKLLCKATVTQCLQEFYALEYGRHNGFPGSYECRHLWKEASSKLLFHSCCHLPAHLQYRSTWFPFCPLVCSDWPLVFGCELDNGPCGNGQHLSRIGSEACPSHLCNCHSNWKPTCSISWNLAIDGVVCTL